MSKFYEGLSASELQEQVEAFKRNFRANFGQEVALWEVADVLQTVLYRKRQEFIEQSFSDYPPTTIEALKTIFHREEQAKTNPHVEAMAQLSKEERLKACPVILMEAAAQVATNDVEAPKPKRSHKKKVPKV